MKIFKLFAPLLLALPLLAQDSGISTHILDISSGKPASDVKVEIYKNNSGKWVKLDEAKTSNDGRIKHFNLANQTKGIYKLKFYTREYYKGKKIPSFYPFIEVSFELDPTKEHYHIPITLSPFGYSTYRGS